MQSECDPRLWSKIENLLRQRLLVPATAAAISPTDHPQQGR
jgi:hypothetical protein